MELNIEIFTKLVSLINSAKNNKDYEFETRFWNKQKKDLINEENYNKVFQKLTFSKENNGLGYSYDMKNILDIILATDYDSGNLRVSINNLENIKKFWLNSKLDEINKNDVIYIEKEKIDKIDDENYNIRFSLNNEIPQQNILIKNKNLLSSNTYEKTYRLKNRYSIKTDDGLFSIDMTSIKMGFGKSFKESNTLKDNLKYEIEIEYIGKNIVLEDEVVAKRLLYHIDIILKLLQNSDILLSNNLINDLKQNYRKLANIFDDNFIAASPVTIHREHLFKNDNIKNIFGKYAVTLKADGERNFLIVHKSNNEENNGKIFIFNSNFEFLYTGYKDLEWTNTLIEAEYVVNDTDNDKNLYMYDILFSKGEDVRRRQLIDFQKESKAQTRLDILDKFLKSPSRKADLSFNETNIIKLKNKKYIQSVRNDGTDIFQKAKEIWDTKQFNTFNVDGIIFVPKTEYYPMKPGPWFSLFKWKPPQLNTIDFLIKVLKDDNKKDIKNPYIEIITRPDGKKETMLKQYKSIQLYCTGYKTIYNSVNHKQTKQKVPVLFNPYDLDEKNSEVYNIVKLFIEDDEKIYANDPITNEKTEIYDDIIVEFSYDDIKENGFKWIPCRFRKDKTNSYKSGKEMYGNSKYTADDVFKAIKLPITEEMITTGVVPIIQDKLDPNQKPYYVREDNNNGKRERYSYQNFHNHYVKYQLLYFSSPAYINEYKSGVHGKILDMCCGNGKDIAKIRQAKYAELVGMDFDYKNIKEAQEWYKNMIPTPKPKAYFVRGDASKLIWPVQACGLTDADKIKIREFIPSKYMFDTISLQFCFHYFFESEITLRTVIQNMNDNLKIGGFVVGTTFDGEKIYNSLKGGDFISGKTPSGETMWRIDKKFTSTKLLFTDKKPNFGKKIDVLVKTIGVAHEEFLVNFNYLDKIMDEYGFAKVIIKPMEEYHKELMEGKNLMNLPEKDLEKDISAARKMSEDEKRWSFFSSGFIYKKEHNSSDSLMKKLVELIEKKDKLRKKDVFNVFNVDADTEHLIEDVAS
jgi:SAM-dependent methyltransferase